MSKGIKMYNEKLGELSYMQEVPTLHSWSGQIDGCEGGFIIILEQPDLEKAEIDFIHSIVSKWGIYIEKALDYILDQLKNQPEIFQVEKEMAKEYLSKEDIPASLPRFCFYDKYEWILHFAESPFPIADPYGLGVAFNKEQPVGIEDFSDAELVEEME